MIPTQSEVGPASRPGFIRMAGRTHTKGVPGVLFSATQTSEFLLAVRKLKEEQKKLDRRTRQAKQKVRQTQRKNSRVG